MLVFQLLIHQITQTHDILQLVTVTGLNVVKGFIPYPGSNISNGTDRLENQSSGKEKQHQNNRAGEPHHRNKQGHIFLMHGGPGLAERDEYADASSHITHLPVKIGMTGQAAVPDHQRRRIAEKIFAVGKLDPAHGQSGCSTIFHDHLGFKRIGLVFRIQPVKIGQGERIQIALTGIIRQLFGQFGGGDANKFYFINARPARVSPKDRAPERTCSRAPARSGGRIPTAGSARFADAG